jgi:hypothetical protein
VLHCTINIIKNMNKLTQRTQNASGVRYRDWIPVNAVVLATAFNPPKLRGMIPPNAEIRDTP